MVALNLVYKFSIELWSGSYVLAGTTSALGDNPGNYRYAN